MREAKGIRLEEKPEGVREEMRLQVGEFWPKIEFGAPASAF